MKPIINHFYWSATTTPSGDGQLIWAKFESFLSHIINKHDNLSNPMFNKCAHEKDIPARKWLTKGNLFITGSFSSFIYTITLLYDTRLLVRRCVYLYWSFVLSLD